MERFARTVKGAGCLVVAGALAVALAGCDVASSLSGASVGTSDGATPTTTSTATAQQDRTVTFPYLYVELTGNASDDFGKVLEEAGYGDVVANDDGSYTATVPAADYQALCQAVLGLVQDYIDSIPASGIYPHATSVDYDEQFATVTVLYDTADLGPEDTFVADAIGEAVCMYQQMASLPVGCDVILVGPDGSELASTMYPLSEGGATGA